MTRIILLKIFGPKLKDKIMAQANIVSQLKDKILAFQPDAKVEQVGYVLEVADGVVRATDFQRLGVWKW